MVRRIVNGVVVAVPVAVALTVAMMAIALAGTTAWCNWVGLGVFIGAYAGAFFGAIGSVMLTSTRSTGSTGSTGSTRCDTLSGTTVGARQRHSPQGGGTVDFVQMIKYQTSKFDEMRKVGDEWEAAAAGGGARRVLMCKDHDNAGQYFTLAFFDSYDAAMENSQLPMTEEFAQRMMEFADGPPTFYNLDVVDDRAMG